MGWFALLRTLLSLASTIANIVREKKLMDAGAKAEIGRQLIEVTRSAGITDRVRAEIEAMSDEAIDAELRGDK
jgi:hypothetical protein